MSNKKKIYRRLGRRCPECNGELNIISADAIINGVKYSEKVIECSDCDYHEDYYTAYNRDKDKYTSKW